MTADAARPIALPELCLDNGWHAGLGVHPDGHTWPWLLAPEDDDEPAPPFPTHELEGPLPAVYRLRLRRPLRCGAPTKAGTPCRIPANSCHWHRKKVTS
jgi:hypothetical protein